MGLALALAACDDPGEEGLLEGRLTRSLLELSAAEAPAPRPAGARTAALKRLAQLTGRARGALADLAPERAVPRLNRLLFEEEGFTRIVKDPPPGAMLLEQVLLRGEGSCLGLSGLYLALGEQLGLPLYGVLAPEHFFVRLQGAGGPRNIELLRRGEEMPRAWYIQKYGAPEQHPLYLRDLTPRQTLAVFRYNRANERRRAGQLREAVALYRQVVAVLPLFAEAQANLGLCYHRLGQLADARRAYERARAAVPDLAGLTQNLRALDREEGRAMEVSAVSLARRLAAIESLTAADCERALGIALRQDPRRPMQHWGRDLPSPIIALDVRIGKTGGVVVFDLDPAADLGALTAEAEALGLGQMYIPSPPIRDPLLPPPPDPVRRWSREHTFDGQTIAFGFEQVGQRKRLTFISRRF